MQAGALATILGAPAAMVIGALVAGAVIAGIRLYKPEVFGINRTQPHPTNVTYEVEEDQ